MWLMYVTPNGLHSDQASMVLDKGIHVVVEKPIGLSKAKCEKSNI